MSAEAIMNITSDNGSNEQSQAIATVAPVAANTPAFVETYLPKEIKHYSYANASINTGAVPKTTFYPKPPPQAFKWTEQIKKILTYHSQGFRLLIIMRGVPGSGKTFLARQIIEATIGSKSTDDRSNTHIYSTDDFFMVSGTYQFDKSKLQAAHHWNRLRVDTLLRQGLSPLILDNTNIEIWEMEPYVRMAVEQGYYIELVEPTTEWARKSHVLLRKNIHNVPLHVIRRMLDNYQNITIEELLNRLKIFYDPERKPPQLRLLPPIPEPDKTKKENLKIETTVKMECDPSLKTYTKKSEDKEAPLKLESNEQAALPQNELSTKELSNSEEIVEDEKIINSQQEKYKEYQIKLEEFEKVERQWENGDSWDNNGKQLPGIITENAQSVEPKPPRKNKSEEESSATANMEIVQNCLDWSKISLFMPAWSEDSIQTLAKIPEVTVETTSSSTCIEIFDTDLDNPNKLVKIILATPRDINVYYIPPENEKIPIKRMLDKSTLTNEQSFRCENEKHQFKELRKLFKNIPKDCLRDIFDNCYGDVSCAVCFIVDNKVSIELKSKEEYSSEEEDDTGKQCSCFDAYNIVPNTCQKLSSETADTKEGNLAAVLVNPKSSASPTPVKKIKKAPSETTVQLKQKIEKSFVISDDHYSEHCLKIKKLRQGVATTSISASVESATNARVTPETNEQISKIDPSDDEESVCSEEAEKTVNINLGKEFLNTLDNFFGRKEMIYPDDIVPRINIPISLLNEINAFWIESLMHQMDKRDKQNDKMLKEDSEVARQIQLKEEELTKAGIEPQVPDFKEIMDMDFALSVYQKEVAEWRNKEPTDMAAKMTRDKLYNIFPDMSPDVLSELLMAHDNNFKETVEVLLTSTGQINILEEKNGLNKFVMQKEIERKEKILAEEKKALSEVEWPLLPKGEKVDMVTVHGYRDKADEHLRNRNENIKKAEEYIRRGMTDVASYYSGLASFHKNQYEHANSLAALYLMQYHAENSPNNATIDLHYLRVSEAKEALDLFLDTHINKLRDSPSNVVKCHTLYFITGRGLHSSGRPVVKPAVKRRLAERNIRCTERNPGLLTAKVSAEDKLTYEVQTP